MSGSSLHRVQPQPDEQPFLSDLHRALDGEDDVRLAVLYGSLARGDADWDSDVDMLVAFAPGSSLTALVLTARLRRVSDRHIDIAHLNRVQARSPLLLERVLEEGQVLVDRDGLWRTLYDQREEIRVRASTDYHRQMDAAAKAIEELTR
jgi:predicted nucleotidyltransferase